MWDFLVFWTLGRPLVKRKRYSKERIFWILKAHEAAAPVPDLARRHDVAEHTIYRWNSKFACMEVSEAKRFHELEQENLRLKKRLAESELDNSALNGSSRENRDGPARARVSDR